MNKNTVIGLMLVIAAGMLACTVAASNGSLAESLFGKAVWYVPYLALVCGVRTLVRARS